MSSEKIKELKEEIKKERKKIKKDREKRFKEQGYDNFYVIRKKNSHEYVYTDNWGLVFGQTGKLYFSEEEAQESIDQNAVKPKYKDSFHVRPRNDDPDVELEIIELREETE